MGFSFSTSSLILVIFWFFDNNHTKGCEMVSHCGFDVYFLIISDAERLFMY